MEKAAGSSGFFLRSKSIAVLLNFVILSPSVPRALVKHLDSDADARGRADTVQAEVKPENPKRQTDPEGKERGKKIQSHRKSPQNTEETTHPTEKCLLPPFSIQFILFILLLCLLKSRHQ